MVIEQPHRNNLHADLHPLLLEFHAINGHLLRAVWHVYKEQSLDKIVLEFDQVSLIVEAESYDDTIIFHLASNSNLSKHYWINASHSEMWSGFIGKTFGWGWIIINQQDAIDGILLSFDGIIPQLMLIVMASSIYESIIQEPLKK